MAGYLVVFTGPMFGRKTMEGLNRIGFLLGSTRNGAELKRAILINHSDDDRDLEQVFSTHDPIISVNKDKIDMQRCSSLIDFKETEHDYIMVDEFQFFKEESIHVVKYWLAKKKYVVISGLIAYSNKKKFGHTIDLLLEADEFEQVKPYCPECTSEFLSAGLVNTFTKAAFTTCLVTKQDDKLVGGMSEYAPACRRHHVC